MLRINPAYESFDPFYKDGHIYLTDNIEDYPEQAYININKVLNTKDDYEIIGLPAKAVICENCSGEGKHLTNSLRDIAFTEEDCAEDPDFIEDMCRGRYDQTCEDCKGDGRYYDINEELCDKEVLTEINNHFEFEAKYARERAYEQRMGY